MLHCIYGLFIMLFSYMSVSTVIQMITTLLFQDALQANGRKNTEKSIQTSEACLQQGCDGSE